jgi:uncharacterized membrane protein YqaE (UPF0057 family)
LAFDDKDVLLSHDTVATQFPRKRASVAPWSGERERGARPFDIPPPNCRGFSVKTLLIATRVLAALMALFVPAIAVLLLVGLVTGQAWWFTVIGLPALIVNAAIVFAKPQRDRVWRWLRAIAGTKVQA